jgi:Tol biopolymer transport system component
MKPLKILISLFILALIISSVTTGCSRATNSGSVNMIVFTSNLNSNWDIYTINIDGSNLTRITDDPAIDSNPAWSPDGTKIAFESDRGGNLDIYIMNADGTNLTNITNNPARDMMPAWSPDDRTFAFQSDRDGDFNIYTMKEDGSDVKRLTQSGTDDTNPSWSPDSRHIAYQSRQTGMTGYILWMPMELTISKSPLDHISQRHPLGRRMGREFPLHILEMEILRSIR